MAVVLINSFEVPEGGEQQCLSLWARAADMRAQLGFIDPPAPLARTGRPIRFVAVPEWESAEHSRRAIATDEFRCRAQEVMREFPHYRRSTRWSGPEAADAARRSR